jgi:hypothetical protein
MDSRKANLQSLSYNSHWAQYVSIHQGSGTPFLRFFHLVQVLLGYKLNYTAENGLSMSGIGSCAVLGTNSNWHYNYNLGQ